MQSLLMASVLKTEKESDQVQSGCSSDEILCLDRREESTSMSQNKQGENMDINPGGAGSLLLRALRGEKISPLTSGRTAANTDHVWTNTTLQTNSNGQLHKALPNVLELVHRNKRKRRIPQSRAREKLDEKKEPLERSPSELQASEVKWSKPPDLSVIGVVERPSSSAVNQLCLAPGLEKIPESGVDLSVVYGRKGQPQSSGLSTEMHHSRTPELVKQDLTSEPIDLSNDSMRIDLHPPLQGVSSTPSRAASSEKVTTLQDAPKSQRPLTKKQKVQHVTLSGSPVPSSIAPPVKNKQPEVAKDFLQLPSDVGAASVVCPYCLMTLPILVSLEDHMKEHVDEILSPVSSSKVPNNAGVLLSQTSGGGTQDHNASSDQTLVPLPPREGYYKSKQTRAKWEKQHAASHSKKKKIRDCICDQCPMAFTQPSDLERHRLIHTGLRPHKCQVCGASFTQLATLKKHMRTHSDKKPHACDLCPMSFSKVSGLNSHKQKMHMSEKTAVDSLKGENSSSTAPSSLSSTASLTTVPSSSEDVATTTEVKNPAEASADNLSSTTKSSTSPKLFKCEICGKTFERNSYLSKHRLRHDTEKRVKCHVCHVGFSDNSKLMRHLRTHTGDRPWRCETCGVVCAKNQHLAMHMQYSHNTEVKVTTSETLSAM